MIETDSSILEDTQVMIPFLKQMLMHGVVSFCGQGGLCNRTVRQRPYLSLIAPANEISHLTFLDSLVSSGYVIVDQVYGMLAPSDLKNIVETCKTPWTEDLAENFSVTERELSVLRSDGVCTCYRIPLTADRLECGSWETFTSEPLDRCQRVEDVLEHELEALSSTSAKQLRYDFVLLTIIDPVWGAESMRFIKTICEVVTRTYPMMITIADTLETTTMSN